MNDRLIHDNWMPVNERLPKKDGWYLVTTNGELWGGNKPETSFEEFKRGNFYDGDDNISDIVIAWQPLPEPYENKGTKNEKSLGEVQLGTIANIADTDWIPLEHFANGGTLCIRKYIWEYAAFDENNSNNWTISSSRRRLNTDFLAELDHQLKENGLNIKLMDIEQDLMCSDGTTYSSCIDKVTLLTADQCREYKPYLKQLNEDWYWTLTADSTTNHYIRYVNMDGTLSDCHVYIGRRGVCPVCMFPSSIRVSEKYGGTK